MMQREKTQKRRVKKGRVAAALVLAMLLGALPVMADDPVDKEAGDADYSVTVNNTSNAQSQDEILAADVVLDIYRVATVKDDNSMRFKTTESFAGTDAEDAINALQAKSEKMDASDPVTSSDIDALAQTIAKTAFDGDGATPFATDVALDSKQDVGQEGLYLIIPHGKDMKADEYKQTTDDGVFYTIADGASKQFMFAPILVSVPSRGEEEFKEPGYVAGDEEWPYAISSGNTANNDDDWVNDVTIDIKVGEKLNDGKLQIIKNIDAHASLDHADAALNDPQTFVFRIDAADKNGNVVYSNVASMYTTGDTLTMESEVFEGIPAGTTITVTEVYASTLYEFKGASVKEGDTAIESTVSGNAVTFEFKPSGDDVVVATVDNTYGGNYNSGGGSVLNTYNAKKQNDGTVTFRPENGVKQDNSNPTTAESNS